MCVCHRNGPQHIAPNVYNPFGGGSHIDDRKRNRSKRIEKFLVRFPIPKLPLFFLLSSSAFFFSFYFIRLNDYIYTHHRFSHWRNFPLFLFVDCWLCVSSPLDFKSQCCRAVDYFKFLTFVAASTPTPSLDYTLYFRFFIMCAQSVCALTLYTLIERLKKKRKKNRKIKRKKRCCPVPLCVYVSIESYKGETRRKEVSAVYILYST
jgi:hypothetical protein